MKKKIINAAIDILLIAVIFAATDFVLLKVFRSESLWLELGVYVVLYAVVFGARAGVVRLWKRRASGRTQN